MYRLQFCLFLAALGVLIGCSSQQNANVAQAPAEKKAATPEEVAREFIDAGNRGDKEGMEQLMTAKAVEGFNSGDKNSEFSVNQSNYEIKTLGPAVVTADEAAVPVDVVEDGEAQSMSLKMRKEDGGWKVYAVGVEADGMTMTVNLENIGGMIQAMAESMGEAMKESFQAAFTVDAEAQLAEAKAQFDSLESLSLDAYKKAWQVTHDYRSQSARDALTALLQEADFILDPSDFHNKLEEPVSTDVRGLSKIEAIERICNEAGVYPVYPEFRYLKNPDAIAGQRARAGAMLDELGAAMASAFEEEEVAEAIKGGTRQAVDAIEEPARNTVTVAELPRPYPVAFTGPFMVEASDVEERVPHATGEIELSVTAFGIDPRVSALAGEFSEIIKVDTVVDAKNRSLKDENVTYYSNPAVYGTAINNDVGVDLFNLIREVETVSRTSGVVKVGLPLEVAEADWPSLEPGMSQLVGDFTVEMKQAGKYTELDVTGPKDRLEDLIVRFWVTDASGEPLDIMSQGIYTWGSEKAQASFNVSKEPAAAKMKLVTKLKTIEYPFELRDIPLQHFAEMPVEIEALQFADADAPVSVALESIKEWDGNFSKIDVKIANHSNKDAVMLHTNLVYLDAAGEKIDDFPSSMSGAFTMDGRMPIADRGKEVVSEQTAFQMPKNTKDVRIEINKVEFIDGTVWERER